MGCDIHSFVERRSIETGRWEKIGDLFPVEEAMEDFYVKHYGKTKPVRIDSPFDNRHYGVFAFLAGVRNYSGIKPLAEPRGLPSDVSEWVRQEAENWGEDGHTHSWLSVRELADFDYTRTMEDRRTTVQIAPNMWYGGHTVEPGQGERKTWAEFLGVEFLRDLEILRGAEDLDECRVVFWFDN